MKDIHLLGAEIINFQGIGKLIVNFTDGFNLLAGTSNAGKSSTLRAILWNILNEPSGDEFIKKGQNEAAVITHWSNGYSIERRRNRGGTKNFYTLHKDGEIVNEYTGFGTKVPPEISEVHGIRPLASGVYFNYANQLESAFLLSNTPKVRAETIGNLEELGRIDEALSKVNEDIRFDQKERKRLDKEIAQLEKSIDSLENKVNLESTKIGTLKMLKESIEERSILVQNVERHLSRLVQIEREVEELSVVVTKSINILSTWDEQLPNKIATFQQLTSSVARLTQIKSELNDIDFMNERTLENLETLSRLVDNASNTFQHMKRLSDRLEEIQNTKEQIRSTISERVAVLDFTLLDKDVEKFRFMFKELNRLNVINEDIESNKQIVSKSTTEIEKLLNRFVDALQNENICPTCSQTTEDITTNDIQKIV